MSTDTEAGTRHHYFVIRADVRNGKPTFVIDDNCVVDPDKPIWDTATDTWSRVGDDDRENDEVLFTALAAAINRLNA